MCGGNSMYQYALLSANLTSLQTAARHNTSRDDRQSKDVTKKRQIVYQFGGCYLKAKSRVGTFSGTSYPPIHTQHTSPRTCISQYDECMCYDKVSVLPKNLNKGNVNVNSFFKMTTYFQYTRQIRIDIVYSSLYCMQTYYTL